MAMCDTGRAEHQAMLEQVQDLFRWCGSSSMQLCASQSLILDAEARVISSNRLAAKLGRQNSDCAPHFAVPTPSRPQGDVACETSITSGLRTGTRRESSNHGDRAFEEVCPEKAPVEQPKLHAQEDEERIESRADLRVVHPSGSVAQSSSTSCSDEIWEAGTARVLLVEVAASSRRRGDAVEQWCRKCGISDIVVLDGRALIADELREVVRSLAARCVPGDTCVLALAGLTATGCLQNDDPSLALGIGQILVDTLPTHVSILSIAGSRSDSEVLQWRQALDHLKQELRVVEMEVFVDDDGRPESDTLDGVCLGAMLRSADALSLADGPCGLSCQAFFDEFTDQVRDLVGGRRGAGALPTCTVLRAHPDEKLAAVVRWPLAARPRNTPARPRTPTRSHVPTSAKVSSSSSTRTFVGRYPVVSWNPHHMSRGYRRDYVGAYASDAQNLKHGDKIVVVGVEFTVRSVEPSPEGQTDASDRELCHIHVVPDLRTRLPNGVVRDGERWSKVETPPDRERRQRKRSTTPGDKRRGARGVPTNIAGLSRMLAGKNAPAA